MSHDSHLLATASSIAPQVDLLFWFMVGMCAVVALGVVIAVVYFAARYRHGSHANRAGSASQSVRIELTWTLIPLALFVAVFAWSLRIFVRMHTAPDNAQTVYVVAKQWMWKVQYAGGQREINTLHVPSG